MYSYLVYPATSPTNNPRQTERKDDQTKTFRVCGRDFCRQNAMRHDNFVATKKIKLHASEQNDKINLKN